MYCKNCGEYIAADDNYCGKCGMPAPDCEEIEEKQPKCKAKVICLVLTIAVLAIGAAVVAVFYGANKEELRAKQQINCARLHTLYGKFADLMPNN